MEHVFWLVEGKLAGRTGPDCHAWELAEFKKQGFSAILSVNEGEDVSKSSIESLGMAYANIPMSSNAPVQEGDKTQCLNNLPKAMAFIARNIDAGPVLVHCRSGKDRTAMVLAAYLMTFSGYSAINAKREILDVRPIAFTAIGWMDFSSQVLIAFEQSLV